VVYWVLVRGASCEELSNAGSGKERVKQGAEQPTDIIVVDDEHLVRWGLANRLQKLGFSVEMYVSAEEALDHLALRGARLVLLDIKLPGMDGMECLRRIREKHHDTTVIMMTGHGSIESSVEAMRTGAYNYVTKPFDFAPLASMVQSVLVGNEAGSAPSPLPDSLPDAEPATPAEPETVDSTPDGALVGSSRYG